MLPEGCNSMVIIVYIKTTTYIFSKQKHQLSNGETLTRWNLLAKIFMCLKPGTIARRQLSNKNQLQKKVFLLDRDNLDSVWPGHSNTWILNGLWNHTLPVT